MPHTRLFVACWVAVLTLCNLATIHATPFQHRFEGIPCHGHETFQVTALTIPGKAYGTTSISFTAWYFSPMVAIGSEPPPVTASLVFAGETAFPASVLCAWTLTGACRLEWSQIIPSDVSLVGAMLLLLPTQPSACAVFSIVE